MENMTDFKPYKARTNGGIATVVEHIECARVRYDDGFMHQDTLIPLDELAPVPPSREDEIERIVRVRLADVKGGAYITGDVIDRAVAAALTALRETKEGAS